MNDTFENTEISSPKDICKLYEKYMERAVNILGDPVAQTIEFQCLNQTRSIYCIICPLYENARPLGESSPSCRSRSESKSSIYPDYVYILKCFLKIKTERSFLAFLSNLEKLVSKKWFGDALKCCRLQMKSWMSYTPYIEGSMLSCSRRTLSTQGHWIWLPSRWSQEGRVLRVFKHIWWAGGNRKENGGFWHRCEKLQRKESLPDVQVSC